MEDNDRFEPVEEKESAFSKLGKYFKNVFGSFIDSFRYNNMKLAAILVALPGLIIGFFLAVHANAISQMTFEYQVSYVDPVTMEGVIDFVNFPGMPFDATAIAIFVLMLFGILNIFNALNMSNKKNKGSVVMAAIFTGILVLFTVYYVYCIMYYKKLTTDGVKIQGTVYGKKTGHEFVLDEVKKLENDKISSFNDNYMISMLSIIISDVLSIAGVVLGFIHYDRTYEKVDR